MNKYLRKWIDKTYPLMGDDIQELDHYDLEKFANWMEEQLVITEKQSKIKEQNNKLEHHKDTTVGLHATDRPDLIPRELKSLFCELLPAYYDIE